MESGDSILQSELLIARGEKKAELVFKNANIINVFTECIEQADVAIDQGKILGVGSYEGEINIDCSGKYLAPGFMDGHIHLESSMMKPVEFAKAVLPHGTTAVITDPHEIANVCGLEGIHYMLTATKNLPLDVYFMLPSCVPATPFDESGCILGPKDLQELYHNDRVLGLAEVMDYVGTIHGDVDIHEKIRDAKLRGKLVDGHAPGLQGKDVCAYILSGIGSDHECVDFDEARTKISLGQWVMIREGTAAKNLSALMKLFQAPFHQRAMLVTDDKHPYELHKEGHIDEILRQAIKQGADPIKAIKMATFNTASYFRLEGMGAIAPGYQADLLVISDLTKIKIEKVIKKGKILFDENGLIAFEEALIDSKILDKVYNSVHCKEITVDDFVIKEQKDTYSNANNNKKLKYYMRVIQFIPGEIITKEILLPLPEGSDIISVERDILKLAVIERHHKKNHIGLGLVNGYGLKKGAIASTISHDSHNIIVIGTNDADMAAAVNCLREMQGGWAIVVDQKVVASLPLPIAGLMSDLGVEELSQKINTIKDITHELGIKEGIDPFMTLAFVSLAVIPELRLITTGLFDVSSRQILPLIGTD